MASVKEQRMNFLKNIADGLKINQRAEDDEYFLDDDYYDGDDDYEDEQPRSGGFFGKKQSNNYEQQSEQRSGGFFGKKITTVSNTSMQVTMKKPKNINDSRDICDELLDGKAVVINLEGISNDVAQRITDFTYGAVYSLDGDIKAISKFILIASPSTVELSGDFVETFSMDSNSNQSLSFNSRSTSYYGDQRMARTGTGFSFNG